MSVALLCIIIIALLHVVLHAVWSALLGSGHSSAFVSTRTVHSTY